MRTPESELLERAEWYQAQHQKLLTTLNDTEKRMNTFKHALEQIRDCSWPGTNAEILSHWEMRHIAREALE